MSAPQTKPVAKDAEPIVALFERLEKEGALRNPSWVFPLRQAGLAKFAELGVSDDTAAPPGGLSASQAARSSALMLASSTGSRSSSSALVREPKTRAVTAG